MIIDRLKDLPTAGKTQFCIINWSIITESQFILRIIEHGYALQFFSAPPESLSGRNPPARDAAKDVLDSEVRDMLNKGATEMVTGDSDLVSVISGIFACPKKNTGKWRPVVNLKPLNRYITPIKFKMEGVPAIADWIIPGAYFCSMDLQDAYYSFLIRSQDRRFLAFRWGAKLYRFKVLCFGLSSAPRIFTKLLKPVINFMRAECSFSNCIYLDDLICQHKSAEVLQSQMCSSALIFLSLGFSINWLKSSLRPSKRIEHLGFIWDSDLMTVSLPDEKVRRLVRFCTRLAASKIASFKELQILLGTMESTRPACAVAHLHMRSLQHRMFDFRHRKSISLQGRPLQDLRWWIQSFPAASSSPIRRTPTLHIYTDASGSGFGGISSDGSWTQGVWSAVEKSLHINVLEMMAARFAVIELLPPNTTAVLHVDNTVVVSHLKKMGGRSRVLSNMALKVWQLILDKESFVLPTWIGTKENWEADLLSREDRLHWDFSLTNPTLERIFLRWFIPTLDAFASQECHILPDFFAWLPDPQALGRDALLQNWPNQIYLFPPVSLIPRVLNKFRQMTPGSQAILIAPHWTSSIWFASLRDLSVDSLLLGDQNQILWSPHTRGPPDVFVSPLAAFLLQLQ